MRTVGAYEAKTHLPQLLDEVASGESITITRNGKPVATLAPVDEDRRARTAVAVEGIRRIRKELNLEMTPEEIKAMSHEGHRH